MTKAADQVPSGSALAQCDRRTFLSSLAAVAGAAASRSVFSPSGALLPRHEPRPALLCLGAVDSSNRGTLQTWRHERGRYELLHAAACMRLTALATHPRHSIVYVANDVDRHHYEPCGSVDSFLIDRDSGRLAHLGTQALSLSAIRPRHLSVSPDGRNLLVAAFAGGAYNVLPLDASGIPAAPSLILKQVGSGPHPIEQSSSHPSHLLFHPRRQLVFATDYGTDRLEAFRTDQEQQAITLCARIACAPGSGPSAMALDPDDDLLVVTHRLQPAISTFRVAGNGIHHLSTTELPSALGPIAFAPRARRFYSAIHHLHGRARLLAWRADRSTGNLRHLASLDLSAEVVTDLQVSNSTLWAASSHGLLAIALEEGRPTTECVVTPASDARALAVFYA